MKSATIVISLLLPIGLTGCIRTGNDNMATDTIARLDVYNGLFCNGYKVWLTHDNPNEASEQSYWVEPGNDKVVRDLQRAQKNRTEVTIHYTTDIFVFCGEGDNIFRVEFN